MGDPEAPEPKHLSTRDGYDRWSTIYDEESNPLIALETRFVPQLLGDVEGLHVADVGCGTGRHALSLAEQGAQVTALDFSPGMMQKARQKPGWENVTFLNHDLTEPLPLPDNAFDRVLCALVLDHIADVTGLFREMGRICSPNGFVLVTVMHPAMMLRGVQARFTDPETGEVTRPASVANQVSDYVMGALAADLRITHMGEHSVDEELTLQLPRSEKYLDWLLLLVLKLQPRA